MLNFCVFTFITYAAGAIGRMLFASRGRHAVRGR